MEKGTDTKTEKPKLFGTKTDLKNGPNRKNENPNAPSRIYESHTFEVEESRTKDTHRLVNVVARLARHCTAVSHITIRRIPF